MIPKLIKVLLVEDDPGDAFWINELLQGAGGSLHRFELHHLHRLSEAREYLAREKPDAVLLDLGLPDSQGMETLTSLIEAGANLPVVVLTGFADEEFEAEAIQQGAQDYLIKGQFNRDQLVRSLRYALERGQAEEALRQSEERYRRLVELSPETVAVHQDGKYVFINQAGARVFGADSPEAICGRSVLDLVHPDYRDLVGERMKMAQKGGRSELRETKILRLDGTVADVEATGLGIDYLGKPAVLALIRDITLRKEAERALRQQMDFVTALLETLGALVVVLDLEGRIVRFNQACEKTTGYRFGEVRGRIFFEMLVPPEEAEGVKNVFGKLRSGDFPHSYENHWVTKSGECRLIAWSNTALIGAGGQVEYVISSGLDITERQVAEEALRRSEEIQRAKAADLQAVLDATPAAVWLTEDPECGRISGNATAYEILRRPAGSNLSKSAPEEAERPTNYEVMKNGRTLPPQEMPVQRAAAGEKIRNYEFDVVFEDGDIRHLLGNAVPLLDELGRPRGSVAAFVDVTERKRAEEDLRRAHDELELRVQERTAALQNTIHALALEAAECLQAEEAAARHAAQVQDLYNNAPCGYHSLDLEGTIVQINDTELSWLGYTREEVLGRLKFSDLMTTESRKTFEQNFPGFKERGWMRDLEYEMVRKDGTILPVLLSATAITDEAGNFLMCRSTLYDVTDRRHAAEILENERQRLLAVLERVPAYVALIAPNCTIPYANREFIKRFGDPENRLCYEFLFGLDAPCDGCRALKVFETNTPELWEWAGPDGNVYQIYDYPFTDVDGSPLVLEMGLDISERKHGEEAVKRSEALMRTILETLPVGVGVCDQDGRIVLANPAAKKIWGGAKYVGVSQYGQYKGWWADTGKRIKPEEWGLARAIQKGETSLNEVVEIESFDKVRKIIFNSSVPIRGPKQEITGAITVNQDITELKAAEAKITRINRLYSVLSKVNEAIVRIREPLHLYQEACRILVNEGGFRMAWVGLADPDSQQVKPVAYEGIEKGYLESIVVTYQDTPEGAGPSGVAIREGRYDICADFTRDPRMAPWRQEALKRGYRSSMALPLRQDTRVVGAIAIYAGQPDFFKDEEIDLLQFMAADLSFALESMDLEKKRRRAAASLAKSEQKLRLLTSQLISAQEQERSRVSRELHDELGQSLLVLKMQMRAIQRQLRKGESGFQEEIATSLTFIDEVIENVRRLSRNLSPLILEGLGLDEALKNLFDDFAKHYGINDVKVKLDAVEDIIPRERQINVYRIFQEALTNIGKYARPTRVTVEMQKMAKGVSFCIEDDGAGFDVDEAMSRGAQEKGMGLAIMAERVKMLGGSFHIKSKTGQGTRITFSLPLD